MFIRNMSFLIFSSLLLFGCQQEENTTLEERTQNSDDYFLQVEQSNQPEEEVMTNTEIADHLASVASNVPNVNSANSLVAGPYSLVAIDVDADLDRTRVGTVKYAVSEALYHDPYGKTAIVVADADTAKRLEGMGEKINQGYPIQGIIDELAAIVGRNMPEFPVQDDQPTEPTEQQEELTDKEQEELEDIKREQSHSN